MQQPYKWTLQQCLTKVLLSPSRSGISLLPSPLPSFVLSIFTYPVSWASQVVLEVKNLPAKAGDIRDVGSVPGLGRFPGGMHGNPLLYSCLENPMDRGAWRATVHRVTKSRR